MNSQKFARIISTLFVPPSFSLITYVLFSIYIEETFNNSISLLITTTLFGFAFPILMFVIMRKKNLVSDQDALIKEQRTLPFIIATSIYLVGLFFLIYSNVSIISIAFWICFISNTIITIIINKYWKISIHSMGASGGFAALMFAFGIVALPFIIIVILVGWSRIKLKCHTFSQVIAGIVLAFISVYFQMYLLTNYFS
ncbi:MAG: phosphatase PAP2 family protein [Ignavibacterium sp.]|nr:phosphatase PAP2 family protein [Ignavibacterium sp.]